MRARRIKRGARLADTHCTAARTVQQAHGGAAGKKAALDPSKMHGPNTFPRQELDESQV